MIKESAVTFTEPVQVHFRDAGFHRDAASLHALHQRFRLCLQVDHEVGNGGLRLQMIVELLVQGQLVVVQCEARKERVLVEQEVGDDACVEQVCLRQVAQLVHALEQEEHLRRQCIARGVAIEAFEERVFLRQFQQRLCMHRIGQPARKRGLAGADRAFDDDVLVFVDAHVRKMK